MALDMTTAEPTLKEYYGTGKVENLTYQHNPLFALMPKDENFGGELYKLPIEIANPQSVSGDFTIAQNRAASSSSTFKKFEITAIKKYGVVRIENQAIEASRNNNLAFISALTSQINGIMNQVARSVSMDMYGAGFGKRGVVNQASFGVTTLQLATVSDVHNFDIGQELVVAAGEASGATRPLGTSGNGLLVTGINRNTGVLTFAANVNDAADGIPAIANGDTIFTRGDRAAGASPARVCTAGLAAWVPETAPSISESFFGTDRSVDSRLYGQFYDASAVPLPEALIEADARVNVWGGQLSHFFMHPLKFAELVKQLSSKVQYVDVKSNVGVGFKGIEIIGMNGMIKVIPDRNCPFDRAWGLQLDKWKLASYGKAIDTFDTDKNWLLRVSDADQLESRVRMYANVCCSAPGWNIQVKI